MGSFGHYLPRKGPCGVSLSTVISTDGVSAPPPPQTSQNGSVQSLTNSALTLFTSTLGVMYLRNVNITAHIRKMKILNRRMNINSEPL
jgi:hypothetical protein